MSEANQVVNLIQEYFINVFRYKYIQYQGRARRKEFWLFALCCFVASLILNLIPFLGVLFSLGSIVPQTCLGIRRLHDIGKSGWWLLLPLTSFLGVVGFLVSMEVGMGLMCLAFLATVIILIVFYCQDSQPGENQYGPNPKGA